MRVTWLKRPVVTLGGIGFFYCLGLLLRSGYEKTAVAGTESDAPRVVRSFTDLEVNISNICEFRLSLFLWGVCLFVCLVRVPFATATKSIKTPFLEWFQVMR